MEKNNFLKIREDFRRDGLAANFLADKEIMKYNALAFPGNIINVGYPAICSGEKRVVKNILENLKNLDIEMAVAGHALKSHLDIIGEMIAPYKNASANFWIPASNDFIRRTLKKNYDEVIKNSLRLVKYFKKKWSQFSIDVALSDVTFREQGIEKRVSQFTKHLHNAGVRSVILCDSRGIATPKEIENLFKKVRQETNGSLEFHPHNDNGLALKNIEIANKFGIKTIGVSLFNSGERNTMLDPRDLLEAGYKINYHQKYLKKLEKEYKEKIGDPIKISKLIFGGKTIITGTQYRLRHRFKEANLIFGVTSDKFILSKILNVKKEFISDEILQKLKNDLYIKRKIFFTAQELIKMKNEILSVGLTPEYIQQ